jgi:hypothetical protein
MSGPLQAAGATSEPSEYATLSMDTQFTGLYTQRNLLRDADVSYVQRKYYGASRFDSISDGINREISARLTDRRRPGSSIYNALIFPAIFSFYSFKYVQDSTQIVRVLADGADGKVYDATAGQKSVLFTKSAGARRTRFQGVGTELFFCNEIDQMKWVRSSISWAPLKTFSAGQFIVDSNNNLQLVTGSQTATITGIQIQTNVLTLFFADTTQITVPVGTLLTFAGMTTIPALNGMTLAVTAVQNSQQVNFAYIHADFAFSQETGTATTGNGTSGAIVPAWSTTLGAITVDAGAQWECRGSSVQVNGIAAPASAPNVTQAPAPSIYPAWAAATWYAPLFVIRDSNNNLQQLTTGGITGGSAPAWAIVAGTPTTDGTAVWNCLGPAAWIATHHYAVGDVIQATFTYYITVQQTTYTWNGHTYVPTTTYVQQAQTATAIFQCSQAGVSGGSAPAWTNGNGTTLTDSSVGWVNRGNAPAWPGATQTLSTSNRILDTNGNVQLAQAVAKSGPGPVTWNATTGAYSFDGGAVWLNQGPYSAANTGTWIYAYSGKNGITKHIGTASPQSAPIQVSAGNLAVIQGLGLPDTQEDQIVLWRTAQGQSTLIYLDTIPNPGAGATWIYTDTTPDTGLNALIPAPVANQNDPPPSNMTAPAFHLKRIWAISGTNVIYSGGPDTIVGSGYESYPPLNFVPIPEQPIRLLPVVVNNGGLLVFTTSNIYIILGDGTQSNPFYPKIYLANVGILGYDALDVVGSTPYFMENNRKVSSFDPSNGYVEVGFPIGDQFEKVTTGGLNASIYDPATTYLTFNFQSSGETAMYVSDGLVGWFRYTPVAPPESGSLWSPRAAIVGGTSAVQSIEVTTGTRQLLIGPAVSGPILMRDKTTRTDNGAAYPAWDVKGNIKLCDTGQIAEIAHIALKSAAIGARPTVSLLMGELAATPQAPFDVLQITSEDPPELPPSQTMYSDRYSAMQNGVTPKGDTFQFMVDYGTQDAADELLEFGIYGAKHEERKQQ